MQLSSRRNTFEHSLRCAFLLLTVAVAAPAGAALDHATLELLDDGALHDGLLTAAPEERGRILLIGARRLVERDPQAARELLLEAESLIAADAALDRSYLLSVRCWMQQQLAELEQARRTCQAAVSAGRASGDARALSRALSRNGTLYFNGGELAAALQQAREALVLAERAGEPGQLAVALNVLGRISRAQGLYDQSLAYFTRGMESVDPVRDPERYRVLAFNVGLSHADLGQYELALDFYLDTLAWTREVGSVQKELVALIYVAKAETGLGRPQAAIERLEQAVLREDLLPFRGLLAQAHATLGDAFLAAGNAAEALDKYRWGLRLAANSNNRFELRELRLGEARALLALGRLAEARAGIDALVSDLRAEGANELLIAAALAQSEIARAQNDLLAALESYQEANRLQESLNRTVADQRLVLARAEFEVDRTELALARAERDALWRNGVLLLTIAALLIGYLIISRRAQHRLIAAERVQSERLERVVNERTNELQAEMAHRAAVDERRLELERRLAEDDKLRVLGQLTGGVAHDFNNLLTVVMGSAELLRARFGSAEAPEAEVTERELEATRLVEHIVTAAASGAGITRALMAYARQQPLHLEKTDLEEFLRERLPLLEHTLGGALSIELQVCTQQAVQVLLDRDQLTTALLNLTLNARDAQNQRGTIRIKLGREDARHAYLAVVDRGAGMTEEQVARACEPFYSTKEEGRGTGLGLSMVYGFTKQLGGELKIDSRIGEGTTIRMVLPLITGTADLRVA